MAESPLALVSPLAFPEDRGQVPAVLEQALTTHGLEGVAPRTFGLSAEQRGQVLQVLSEDVVHHVMRIAEQHQVALRRQTAAHEAFERSVADARAFGQQLPWPAPGNAVDAQRPVTLPSLSTIPYLHLETVLLCRAQLQAWMDRVNRALLTAQDDIDASPEEVQQIIGQMLARIQAFTNRLFTDIWPQVAVLGIVRENPEAVVAAQAAAQKGSAAIKTGGAPAFGEDYSLYTAFIQRDQSGRSS